MTALEQWLQAACAELGVAAGWEDVRVVLELARDVAHGVERPAAPVTSFLLGLAVGRGGALDDCAERLRGLAEGWAGGGIEEEG